MVFLVAAGLASEKGKGKGVKLPSVLVVDDDSGTCETLSDILELNGFKVTTVKSGEECVKLVNQRHFDVILMDIKMPGMNGVEAFRMVKEMDEKTQVIMMTAYAVNDLVAEAMDEGVFAVVHKPLDLDELVSLVRGD